MDEEDPNFINILHEIGRQVGIEARRKAFAAGIPIVYEKDGRIVREYEDGTIEDLRQFQDEI